MQGQAYRLSAIAKNEYVATDKGRYFYNKYSIIYRAFEKIEPFKVLKVLGIAGILQQQPAISFLN